MATEVVTALAPEIHEQPFLPFSAPWFGDEEKSEIMLEEGIRELYEWIKPHHTIDLSAAPQFNNQAMIREFAQSAAAQQSTLRMLQNLAECA